MRQVAGEGRRKALFFDFLPSLKPGPVGLTGIDFFARLIAFAHPVRASAKQLSKFFLNTLVKFVSI